MKLHFALLATALLSAAAIAGETVTAPAAQAPQPEKRLTGSLNLGYATNYSGRGIVASHAVAEGDSIEFAAAKFNYDFGRKDAWSWDSTVAYTVCSSGHRLYGNPNFGLALAPMGYVGPIKEANIENEFVLHNALKYTTEKGNISFGHNFVHGGILGVMAKHYRDQGASCVNEVFVTPEWTPYKWLSVGCTTSFSFQGITGWWIEPYITAKAPIIGTPENIKMAGICKIGLTATADYFDSRYNACANGTEAFYIALSTPYFVTDKFIITPGVSFNWLGKGGLKANEKSEFRQYSMNANNVPFRNFAVIGSVAATYKF